jgi:pimeloyl-ACP methyl ester carboxylesterase
MNRRQFLQSSVLAVAAPAALREQTSSGGSSQPRTRSTREELVTAPTEDGLVMTGLLVTPDAVTVRPIAVIWIHGASENFYLPNYVNIARATARRGFPFISANTRMHGIGSVLSYRRDLTNRRGGSYWGLPSKQPIDIAAWLDFASTRGYRQVVIVGHSAGGPAVRRYLVERNDSRVRGIVMASVGLGPAPPRTNPDPLLETARQMVVDGRGQDFLPNLRLSAATYVDYAETPVEIWDFYGTLASTSNPAIRRVRVPLLAWFGSRETDIGTAADLERLKTLVVKHGEGPPHLDTQLIRDADHIYEGQEEQVATILADWINSLPLADSR